jgi:UBX domain-containing protein 1
LPKFNKLKLLKRAQETAGATDEDPSLRTERFAGGGHKLGGEGHPSQKIEKPKPKEPEKVKLTMWKDGFTINEEVLFIFYHVFNREMKEIRLYNDPKNKEFLDQITSGKLPMELIRFGTEVALEMEDRREDDFEQNKVLLNYRTYSKCILAKTSFQNFYWKWKQIRFFRTRPFNSCSKSS